MLHSIISYYDVTRSPEFKPAGKNKGGKKKKKMVIFVKTMDIFTNASSTLLRVGSQ